MIDTLLKHRAMARERVDLFSRLGIEPRHYAVCTLHRPSNVDTAASARTTLAAVTELSKRVKVVLPIHPRTSRHLQEFGLLDAMASVAHLIEPLGYLDFLALLDHAQLVLTDSGGIQEETTVLGVPCLTFRENTERPITVTHGTNRIVGLSPSKVAEAADEIISGKGFKARVPDLWDGHAAERILEVLRRRA
jgi:UDP-N-acetylglucosamine 2-epimerase (non-hydrolysing)